MEADKPRVLFSKEFTRAEYQGPLVEYPPHLREALLAITKARMKGKKLAPRKPFVGLRYDSNYYMTAITPVLRPGPKGWRLEPYLRITTRALLEPTHGLHAVLGEDDKLRLRGFWRTPDINNLVFAAMDNHLLKLAEDTSLALKSQGNRCALCHRRLTSDKSKLRGVGKECWKTYQRMIKAAEKAMVKL